MKKEFVPYELAVKLKALGFDELCLMYYDYSWALVESGVYECKAPLYQQAFRWFRKKEFLIDVTSLNSDEYEFYIKWSFAYSLLSDHYKTYEEAEFACLEKLIEIVELKKES